MKRFFVFSLLGAATVLGLWYGLRGAGSATSSATVTALLPKGTLALLYLPDFKRTRAQWHETDLYKLWREPAMQDFLQRPLSRLPADADARQRIAEMEALGMRDAFLAVTAEEEGRPAFVAGFRFKGSAAQAERVIGPWRARLRERLTKHETVTYEGHEVELLTKDAMTAATVYAGDWFFISNDVPSLKAVVDRVDRRVTDSATTLTADEHFAAANKHMPREYAILGYARLDQLMEKMAANSPATRKIQSIAAATSFAEGKIRDVIFLAMPKIEGDSQLTRSSLALATKETFLYLASVLRLPQDLKVPDADGPTGSLMPSVLRRYLTAAGANGITRADFTDAFEQEIGIVGDWSANTRFPTLAASLAVKDSAKAARILEAITAPETEEWAKSEKDGVQYFAQPRSNPMLPIAPTIGLSPKLLVAGVDQASVEQALQRAGSSASEFAGTDVFKAAERLVPAPTESFTYVDTALLYQRLDAAVRPMLIMAAAFMPKVSETVDLGKLPAVDVITKHLSPLVISQRYDGDGYKVEAVGPISVFQAAVAGIVASGVSSGFYQKQAPPEPATAEPSPDESSPTSETPTPGATPESPDDREAGQVVTPRGDPS